MRSKSVLLLGLLALPGVDIPAAQAGYPEKPVRLIVNRPAGSQADTVARVVGQKIAEALGKAIVVVNIPGGAGNIGADRVAKATPDGYTFGLLADTQLVVNPSLYKLPYDSVKDFAPVSQVSAFANMLVVNNAVPAKSVRELIALAKARPGQLTYASGGGGGSTHLSAELFKFVGGLDIRHIPYKGGIAAIPDLVGGRVTMMFGPISVVLPVVREGKLRALAVTSSRRSPAAPDLPTIAEAGYPGFEVAGWLGLLAPATPPAAIVSRLHTETVKAVADTRVRAKFADMGMDGIGNSPAEFAGIIKSEIPKWAKIIRDVGIRQD